MQREEGETADRQRQLVTTHLRHPGRRGSIGGLISTFLNKPRTKTLSIPAISPFHMSKCLLASGNTKPLLLPLHCYQMIWSTPTRSYYFVLNTHICATLLMKSLKIHSRTLRRHTRKFFANPRQHNHEIAVLPNTNNTSSPLLKCVC